MKTDEHDAIVRRQFDSQARAYLASAVHATGADLDELARLIGPRPTAAALDLGCGAGHATFRLAPLVGTVVAYDLSESMLAVVAEEAGRRGLGNVVTRRGAVGELPFAPASFDLAVTRYSAHHWADVPAALAQMRRALKPGGLAIVVDVVAPQPPLLDTWLQSLELLRDPSHVRNHSVSAWQAMLASAGFAPGPASEYRLHLDFAAWVERMKTPAAHVAAIRSLQRSAGAEVTAHFAFEDDGSFTIDAALVAADAVPAAVAEAPPAGSMSAR